MSVAIFPDPANPNGYDINYDWRAEQREDGVLVMRQQITLQQAIELQKKNWSVEAIAVSYDVVHEGVSILNNPAKVKPPKKRITAEQAGDLYSRCGMTPNEILEEYDIMPVLNNTALNALGQATNLGMQGLQGHPASQDWNAMMNNMANQQMMEQLLNQQALQTLAGAQTSATFTGGTVTTATAVPQHLNHIDAVAVEAMILRKKNAEQVWKDAGLSEAQIEEAELPDGGLQVTSFLSANRRIRHRIWKCEPSELSFMSSGFLCEIQRNALGVLCGYVAIGENHPVYSYFTTDLGGADDVRWINKAAHGGIDFADQGIIGFSCGKAGDFCPDFPIPVAGQQVTYQTIGYVMDALVEVARLVKDFNTLPF